MISIRGNKCAQIFVTDKGHAKVYPIPSKAETGHMTDLTFTAQLLEFPTPSLLIMLVKK